MLSISKLLTVFLQVGVIGIFDLFEVFVLMWIYFDDACIWNVYSTPSHHLLWWLQWMGCLLKGDLWVNEYLYAGFVHHICFYISRICARSGINLWSWHIIDWYLCMNEIDYFFIKDSNYLIHHLHLPLVYLFWPLVLNLTTQFGVIFIFYIRKIQRLRFFFSLSDYINYKI